MIAQTMGNPDRAIGHFEDALAFCRKAGYRPELAWSCCDYAEALLFPSASRGGSRIAPTPSDLKRGTSLLLEALAISRDLGMSPLEERAVRFQDRAKSLPAAAPAYPDGLTQREVEVLGLVSLGMINQEIAEELIISLRTVANHVTNILNKTGAANRTEEAVYATRNGLA
jgi:DNA-binding CsgD family transcriptional regulator